MKKYIFVILMILLVQPVAYGFKSLDTLDDFKSLDNLNDFKSLDNLDNFKSLDNLDDFKTLDNLDDFKSLDDLGGLEGLGDDLGDNLGDNLDNLDNLGDDMDNLDNLDNLDNMDDVPDFENQDIGFFDFLDDLMDKMKKVFEVDDFSNGDAPAVWQPLKDKYVSMGSKDNTMVYKGLALMCKDPDDAEFVKIVTQPRSYKLKFSKFDMLIEDLDPYYEGSQEIVVSCNGVKASFNLIVEYQGHGAKAKWQELSDKSIIRGSPDGTTIYPNLALKCNDRDDPTHMYLASDHVHYELYFDGYDLKIEDLNRDYIGTETIELRCNGVSNSFKLRVYDYSTPGVEDDEDEESEDEMTVYIGSIRIPEAYEVMPGDELYVNFNFENSGDRKLEDVKVAATIMELGARSTAGPFDVKTNRNQAEKMILHIPETTEPGMYTVRFTIHNNEVQRVVHREIEVI